MNDIITIYLLHFQDDRLKETQAQLDNIQIDYSKAKKQIEDYAQQMQQLKDQNALLKATKGVLIRITLK